MKLRRTGRILALAAAAVIGIAASGNWNTRVIETEAGHRIGNPEAPVTLSEFVSYTCPHCATFTREGEPALQLAYIGPGKVALEIRPIIRNPVDLTAAMLVQCGDPSRFSRNHAAFMHLQPTWLEKATRATDGQKVRWMSGDPAARRRAIASDLGFYRIMESRGYRQTDADKCLADNALAQRLAERSVRDLRDFGLSGTPSFAINGETLARTHDWRSLQPQLDARF